MKLDVDVNEVEFGNTEDAVEFKIRNSAKAFKILSSGLYSNKKRAIIRELSCNARDSHVAAGKKNVPFEVHLPTMLEPYFAVKDFGIGLDDHEIKNIYTTYFESTKTKSNRFIGALGLGSKSPLSYTENFTVTAIKKGMKRIYSVFINDHGVPSVVLMTEEKTTDGNGVEVKFSVTDKYDFSSFAHEAEQVFKWFDNKPIITGLATFKHTELKYKEKNIIPGVHTLDDKGYGNCTALMGNIPYPIGNISEPKKHFGDLAKFLECDLVLEFKIGDLDFAASREELSYIPSTIANIKKRFELLEANLYKHLSEKANSIKDLWERAFYLLDQAESSLFNSSVKKYVKDTKFPLIDIDDYRLVKRFKLEIEEMQKKGISLQAFEFNGLNNGNGSTRMNSYQHHQGNSVYVEVMDVRVEDSTIIVLNDIKTGCSSRARFHFSNSDIRRGKVMVINHNSPDMAVRQVQYDKILKDLSNPPKVYMASTLNKQVKATRTPSSGILKLVEKRGYSRRNTGVHHEWLSLNDEIKDDETYYYVILHGHQVMDKNGKEIEIFNIKYQMENCGIDEVRNITIHGVRKSRLEEIQELDNWVWFEDKLNEELAKVNDNHITSLVAAEVIDGYNYRQYTNKTIAKMVGTNSDYAKFVNDTSKIKRSNGRGDHLINLCQRYGKKLEVETVKKKLTSERDALIKKYPLLAHISYLDNKEKDVAQYIRLIDNQEKV